VYVCKAYDYCDLVIVLKRKAPAVDYVFLVDKELILGNIEYLTRKIHFEKEHNDDANAERVLYLKEDVQPFWHRERPTQEEKGQMVTKSGLEVLLRLYHGTIDLYQITYEELVHTRALADAWTIDTVRDAMDDYFKTHKLGVLEKLCSTKKLNVEQTEEEAFKAKLFEEASYVVSYMNALSKNAMQFETLLAECVGRVTALLANEVVGYVVLREADRHNLIPLLYPESPSFAKAQDNKSAAAKKRAKARKRKNNKRSKLLQEKADELDTKKLKQSVDAASGVPEASGEPSSNAPGNTESAVTAGAENEIPKQ